jgi:putative ABC transport system permease protein
MDGEVEKKITDQPFVAAASSQLFIKSLSQASCCSAWNVFLVGFDPETDFTIRPWLGAHLDRPLRDDEVLVGAVMGAEPGAALKFFGTHFKVAGRLEATGMGLDAAVFMPMKGAHRMAADSARLAEQKLEIGEGQISAVLIRLRPELGGGLPAYRAAFELEQAIPEISILQPDDLVVRTHKSLASALGGLRSAGYAVWAVTAALIGLVFAMAANERRREIGLLRALGAGRGKVFSMIVGEALAITAAGAALGLVAGFGLTGMFSRLIAMSLKMPLRWAPWPDLAGLGAAAAALALLTGAAAVLVPAIRAALMEPYESIRGAD